MSNSVPFITAAQFRAVADVVNNPPAWWLDEGVDPDERWLHLAMVSLTTPDGTVVATPKQVQKRADWWKAQAEANS